MRLVLLGVTVGALGLSTWAWPVSAKPSPVVIKVGQHRTFLASQLPSGSIATCTEQGHALSVTVPAIPYDGAGSVWTKPGKRFYLNVNLDATRSAVVRCGVGGVHW
jgi:hypothetical protein